MIIKKNDPILLSYINYRTTIVYTFVGKKKINAKVTNLMVFVSKLGIRSAVVSKKDILIKVGISSYCYFCVGWFP